jgi:hypothetical protein
MCEGWEEEPEPGEVERDWTGEGGWDRVWTSVSVGGGAVAIEGLVLPFLPPRRRPFPLEDTGGAGSKGLLTMASGFEGSLTICTTPFPNVRTSRRSSSLPPASSPSRSSEPRDPPQNSIPVRSALNSPPRPLSLSLAPSSPASSRASRSRAASLCPIPPCPKETSQPCSICISPPPPSSPLSLNSYTIRAPRRPPTPAATTRVRPTARSGLHPPPRLLAAGRRREFGCVRVASGRGSARAMKERDDGERRCEVWVI